MIDFISPSGVFSSEAKDCLVKTRDSFWLKDEDRIELKHYEIRDLNLLNFTYKDH